MTTANATSPVDLLAEIRDRLQTVHFAARGLRLFGRPDAQEAVPDQLHAIRVLAEQLDARLGAD